MSEGGAFATFQDPLWYPRRSKGSMALDRAAYFAWRLGQPSLWQGVQTRLRRARGELDESNRADMVEYHVVRQGVDEERLRDVLAARFTTVDLWTYWSTQAGLLQRGGTRLGSPNTFGLVARSARPLGPA